MEDGHSMADLDKVQVVDVDGRCPILPIVDGDGVARAVIWPGMGATARSMHRITLNPGARTTLLRHPMEAVYYVISGVASIHDGSDGTSEQLRPGSMAFVEPDTAYMLAAGAERVELVGGPCPPDPSLYRHLRKR
jgi:mannose-6-phosphate isomerase-like protein (cupin superfamily)